VRIAVDAMGGDLAPEAPVAGALTAVRAVGDLEVVLVGREPEVRRALGPDGTHPRIQVVHRDDVIAPGESPVAAVRSKPTASLVEVIRLVRRGEVAGAVSAGNTGAMMAAGLLVLGRVPGVDRPALSAVLPSRRPSGVLLLDVGANVEARAPHLVQYAWMGSLYAAEVLGVKAPRVGLLNVGTEAGKGPSLLQEVHARLSRERGLNFVGNVESRDLLVDAADVVVTDGFVGNVVLKGIEGTAEEVLRAVRGALKGSWRGRIGGLIAQPALSALRRRLDYQEVGGVPLLGLDGVVIKAHGASGPRAFHNSILRAREQAERAVNALIKDALGPSEEEESP
jgi:glycerol-3-phosphate acyltransferase PlsX